MAPLRKLFLSPSVPSRGVKGPPLREGARKDLSGRMRTLRTMEVVSLMIKPSMTNRRGTWNRKAAGS
jgi:hypothetical protein